MKIAVVGTGYVGLVTGTCFADAGIEVTCIDVDANKVAQMQKGEIPIYEPGLEVLFHHNIGTERLKFTTSLKEGIKNAEVIFLALPTPPGEDGSADLSYVMSVADDLSKLIDDYVVIVDKSTVPIGTADKVRQRINEKTKAPFDVVSNPEFLREGHAVADFQDPDRIVVGTASGRARKIMEKLYDSFVRQGSIIVFMDERSAEMTKYAANSFLAAKISFMNEIANLCEKVGANVDEVRIGIGRDPRIGSAFLYSGIGYGGSCFPKDVEALQHIAAENKSDLKILKAVSQVNNKQKTRLTDKVLNYFNGSVRGKSFALWGLAFKPDTDDIREAPAFEIIKELINQGATITAYDPEAMENVKKFHSNIKGLSFANDSYAALKDNDALIIATEWSVFQNPDFGKIKKLLKNPTIFDGRNIYDRDTMAEQGFYYESIGRPTIEGKK